MAVGRDDGTIDVIHMLLQILNLIKILLWQTVTRSIRNVYDRSSSLDHSLHHLSQILIVSTSGILAIELHIVHIALGILSGCYSLLQNLFASGIELKLNMLIAGADTRMDTLILGILQRLEGHIDIALHSTRKRTNHWPRNGFRNFNHTVKVTWT